jgi:hypothetical protein
VRSQEIFILLLSVSSLAAPVAARRKTLFGSDSRVLYPLASISYPNKEGPGTGRGNRNPGPFGGCAGPE